MLSKRLLSTYKPEQIILIGCLVTALGAGALVGFTLSGLSSSLLCMGVFVACVFILLLGIGMAIPNCLSLALVRYSDVLGTAGAIFGLGYYLIVSLITSGMSYLHNDSLVTMPMYFFVLAAIMVIVSRRISSE
ncbi:Bcr/CflA family drug resistance transporter [Paenibacillus sp. NAIST15-1]|nr:Bcr/CflA family drug resistance transporter [Paenibacillus sp. NAIST15-1]